MRFETETVATTPFGDQKPGTSGLRKKVRDFQRPSYLENFVQSILDVLEPSQRRTLVLGGDGRYFNREAASTILRIAAANGIGRVIVGKGALLSTPAVSSLIRARGAGGGVVLSASHNPGGIDGDFGVKFNNANGAPAPEGTTEKIYKRSLDIDQYLILKAAEPEIDRLGEYRLNDMVVEVVDPVDDYQRTMESVFDFNRLKEAFANRRLSICFDGMHAVTGPYARRILEEALGAPPGSVINAEPLHDFGGGHPDPNLAHARSLVERMARADAPILGAASDGDGDRNLILGRNFFVSPSDSLALIAAHADAIPQFGDGLVGVARSMPTSRALDRVAEALGIPCYETPTGWKYFGNLLDAGLINLCGEESFGTGGDHVREKDGLWTVLAWLSLLEQSGRGVSELVVDHWQRFGRDIYCRHDYEGIDADAAAEMMKTLADRLPTLENRSVGEMEITRADEFRYRDPVDDVVSGAQGIRIMLGRDARIVFRLSGTGTSGATLRVYLEQYRADADPGDALRANERLGRLAADIAAIESFTGMTEPTLAT